MKKTFLFLFLIISQVAVMGQTVNYTASTSVIANPERGLQKYSISGTNYATTVGANNLPVATLNSWKNSTDKVTVVYRYYLLDAFMNSNINSTFLNNMQTDFNNIRSAGFKVIVRFAYSNSEGTVAQQPTKAQILTHISQLSSLLTNNKDVIFSLQAGFIGTWGEWYYTNSSEYGTDGAISAIQWGNRKEIIDAMLAMTPIEIPIQVRYVGIKQTMYGTTQLTPATAYQQNANARIGFYNDAFLNNYGDMGTFSADECTNPVGTPDYNYLSNETNYLPMTGETNGLNTCDNGYRTKGDNAVYEMGLTNWTTLNRDYHPDFWNQINASQYDKILKNLGYRFVLNSSTVQSNGSNFNLTLNITNVGNARPFKQRDVYLIMKNTATNSLTTRLLNTDIRTWENSISITQNFNPGITGVFQFYLWMPDKESLLSSNSDYSIQFANNGTWESATGFNNLLQTVNLNTLGMQDFSFKNNLSIYPNPASDFIKIQLNSSEKEEIQIYDSVGQLVKIATISNNDKIDVSKFTSGIYFIRLKNNPSLSLKFVKL
ncbi:DUF4832 domain-containing protein [Flavobacterium sp. Fl-77]|uniref:DUF4832 domain-containing protein n=1 Tax=Flavobacterium flavipigmentatum TaxID=2893884 RepID=A0AAJ2S8K8_9FLAO|nr:MULTISPECIES: DUF4832 domain-containing protein [unclassified Flavobacterium]MDX6183319.1 DUF4832 domain-containing protein [Flavobacterium sp. Fl-33]MDX6186603.1 DUF4832 domain-containing protein [Flavobacterium sp. Fl-77]UFH38628.1 DUF4832 domain-containing protein [Flavobacterium sp. F-70]